MRSGSATRRAVARSRWACRPRARAPSATRPRWEPGVITLFHAQDGLEATLEVCVATDADFEIRRVRIANRSDRARSLDVTTSAEVVLHQFVADAEHPAFSKLFIQTECPQDRRAILARRRPRGNDETHPVLVHALLEPGRRHLRDRSRALARARRQPGTPGGDGERRHAERNGRQRARPGGLRCAARWSSRPALSATLTFVLGVGDTRESALDLLPPLEREGAVDAVFEGARAFAEGATAALGRLGRRRRGTAGAGGGDALRPPGAPRRGSSACCGPRAMRRTWRRSAFRRAAASARASRGGRDAGRSAGARRGATLLAGTRRRGRRRRPRRLALRHARGNALHLRRSSRFPPRCASLASCGSPGACGTPAHCRAGIVCAREASGGPRSTVAPAACAPSRPRCRGTKRCSRSTATAASPRTAAST